MGLGDADAQMFGLGEHEYVTGSRSWEGFSIKVHNVMLSLIW